MSVWFLYPVWLLWLWNNQYLYMIRHSNVTWLARNIIIQTLVLILFEIVYNAATYSVFMNTNDVWQCASEESAPELLSIFSKRIILSLFDSIKFVLCCKRKIAFLHQWPLLIIAKLNHQCNEITRVKHAIILVN